MLEIASEEGCKEALFTFGERPYDDKKFNDELEKLGYKDFWNYYSDIVRKALSIGLLPHTNPGVVEEEGIDLMKEHNASIGLMLETSADLFVHDNCPGKKPKKRIEFIKKVGEKNIPLTTGLLVGIGETFEDRLNSLKTLKKLDGEYDHIQEIIIQGYHKNENIKDQEKMRNPHLKSSAKDIDVFVTAAIARIIFKEKEIQIPPNLHGDIKSILSAGASDLGGISISGDFINPEDRWPPIDEITKTVNSEGFEVRERLPIHSSFIKKGWLSEQVADVIKELSENSDYTIC